jgi:hypothetical protein
MLTRMKLAKCLFFKDASLRRVAAGGGGRRIVTTFRAKPKHSGKAA